MGTPSLGLTDFLLSTPLPVDPVTIRHCEGEQRQITMSVNDLLISCWTLNTFRLPDRREVGSSTLPRPIIQNLLPRLRIWP